MERCHQKGRGGRSGRRGSVKWGGTWSRSRNHSFSRSLDSFHGPLEIVLETLTLWNLLLDSPDHLVQSWWLPHIHFLMLYRVQTHSKYDESSKAIYFRSHERSSYVSSLCVWLLGITPTFSQDRSPQNRKRLAHFWTSPRWHWSSLRPASPDIVLRQVSQESATLERTASITFRGRRISWQSSALD